jgi:hypothetical protein
MTVMTPGFTADASLGSPGRRYAKAALASAGAPKLRAAQGIPIYGNWCGPGHGGSGPPLDPVDRVCCLHDRCYDDRGYFDCSCDRDLIGRMPAAIVDSRTPPAGAAAGSAAMIAFSALPCFCHRLCLPFVGCIDTPIPIPGIGKICPPPLA